MGKRDSIVYPPKHKELRVRMVESMLNSSSDAEGKGYHKFGDHYATRFLK